MPSYYTPTPTPERCVASMKKSGKLAVAVIAVAVGVLLLLVGNRRSTPDTDPTPNTPPEGVEAHSAEDYRLAVERRVADICAEVAGAGHVSVVVTLEGGYEYVYAYDKKTTVGGESQTYITVGNGSDEALVYITERAPAISGIGVVCSGGTDPVVKREITALLSAAFGVPANKIYVAGGK